MAQWLARGRHRHGAAARLPRLRIFLLIAAPLLAACAAAPSPRAAAEHLQRVELLALLQTLNADLLSHDSATLTLERWCADHGLAGNSAAEPARIVARRIRDADKPLPDDLRARLAIANDQALRYRRVQLACGGVVLSEADNWYVPARLGPGMERALETTDTPFGKVVAPLGFQRSTLSAQLLWSPLAAGWELSAGQPAADAAGAPLHIPHVVLQHRAILVAADGTPFAALIETYSGDLLRFGAWQRYSTVPTKQ